MFSAGDFTGDDDTDDVVFRDAARGVHKKLVIRDDKLIGAVLYGEAQRQRLVFRPDPQRHRYFRAMRDTLVFGPSAGGGEAPGVEVAAGHSGNLRLQRRQQGHHPGGDRPSTS